MLASGDVNSGELDKQGSLFAGKGTGRVGGTLVVTKPLGKDGVRKIWRILNRKTLPQLKLLST